MVTSVPFVRYCAPAAVSVHVVVPVDVIEVGVNVEVVFGAMVI
jgi:hypothetical protein